MKCRHCAADLELSLIDLGSSPPSNAYLTETSLKAPEKWFPLKVLVCTECWLAQTEDYAGAKELFDAEYAYFSSFSNSWLKHAEQYVEKVVTRFGLDTQSHVVEVAANDGYLLQYVKARGIPCLGIEPTKSTADAARAKGIDIEESFFGIDLANELVAQGKRADLMAANNVLAHVPNINDFVSGFRLLLKPQGVATFEFPHLMQLIEHAQFDTIYHEHFSYLSLTAVKRIFETSGLQVFDVEEIPTHGGSLRVYAQVAGSGSQSVSPEVASLLAREESAGINDPAYYRGFQQRAERIKHDLLAFLLEAKRQGKKVMAYGAAAKGNTLLNYAGVREDLLPMVVDRNPAKQNKYLPGSRIPIVSEDAIQMSRPDYILILPWNLCEEVQEQLSYAREWGTKFAMAVPDLGVM
jgi:2-polyprenyl-3-methyl-5-hydroxy-6-metoxy-1,4-benzoquinol methylase